MKNTKRIVSVFLCIMLVVMLCPGYVLATGTQTDSTEETAGQQVVQTVKLSVKAATATSVTLKWKKLDNVSKYYIYRSYNRKKGYKKIATVKASKNTYKNSKLKEKKNYYYKVVALLKDNSRVTSNIKVKVKVKGNYKAGSVYGPSLTQSQLKYVKNAVANFVNVYTEPGMDDFVKVFYAHNYICNRCSYQNKGWWVKSANTAYGAFRYKKAQCSGYSRAFKALCDGMGIGCRYVHANSKAMNPSHQWNLVKVDKKWYLIDTQLNDSSGGYFCFLIGSKTSKKYFENVYKYNTKGMPKLSKSDYDYSKYFE
jgi:transglutaminase/protease-like cytokinesis protein 3